jgi:hypothetical protein
MVDVPTPSEIAEESEEKGNEPTSLGDVAQGGQSSVRDDEVVPDRRDNPQGNN